MDNEMVSVEELLSLHKHHVNVALAQLGYGLAELVNDDDWSVRMAGEEPSALLRR